MLKGTRRGDSRYQTSVEVRWLSQGFVIVDIPDSVSETKSLFSELAADEHINFGFDCWLNDRLHASRASPCCNKTQRSLFQYPKHIICLIPALRSACRPLKNERFFLWPLHAQGQMFRQRMEHCQSSPHTRHNHDANNSRTDWNPLDRGSVTGLEGNGARRVSTRVYSPPCKRIIGSKDECYT